MNLTNRSSPVELRVMSVHIPGTQYSTEQSVTTGSRAPILTRILTRFFTQFTRNSGTCRGTDREGRAVGLPFPHFSVVSNERRIGRYRDICTLTEMSEVVRVRLFFFRLCAR